MKNLIRRITPIVIMSLSFYSCGGGGGGGGSSENIEESIVVEEYGPTAYYSFDEDSGVTAFNSSFDELHGVLFGVRRVEGKINNALDFSLNGAYLEFKICCNEDSIEINFPNNSFTIAAWIKPNNVEFDTIYPLFGGWYGSLQSMRLRINNSALELLLYPLNSGIPNSLVTSSLPIVNNQWQHIAVTYNGTQAIVYIDGLENNVSDISMPVEKIFNTYFIGGIPLNHSAGGGAHNFPGIIDEFYFSENAFSAAEIKALAMASQ